MVLLMDIREAISTLAESISDDEATASFRMSETARQSWLREPRFANGEAGEGSLLGNGNNDRFSSL
jgi:hypothetical protein